MSTEELDRMLQGGAKGYKFEKPGDSVTGIVTDVMVRQATEYGTGKPQTFDNGDPREQVVVILKAEGVTPDDEDDDLHRAVYIKGWGLQRRALIEAVRQAKAKRVEVGDRFTATLTRMEPSKQGGFPAKVFEYRIQPMQAEADQGWASQGEVDAARKQVVNLLAMPGQFTLDQISRATGIDVAEVESIQRAHSVKEYGDDTPF